MPDITPQIIAMGGGGFSMEPDNPLLDRYILEQAAKSRPAVAFLPTATGDADGYIVSFYTAFTRLPCEPSHLAFFRRVPDLRDYLFRQDVIYVGGGNTKSMLGIWKEWGLPELLREAWERGVILAGLSAGALCWFESGVTDSWAGGLSALPGLGFLKGSCCPHYDGEPERRPAYHRLVAAGELVPGFALEDGAALHFHGQEVFRTVASRPNAHAYQVTVAGDQVIEVALPAEYLGK